MHGKENRIVIVGEHLLRGKRDEHYYRPGGGLGGGGFGGVGVR